MTMSIFPLFIRRPAILDFNKGPALSTKVQVFLPTLPTKVHLVKAMVFLVVMYESESWTIKKAEGQRKGAFALWCWRRLLRAPLTARKSN